MNDLAIKTDQEIESMISDKVNTLLSDGYNIVFGNIGKRTTYCMISRGDEEILGYTYIRGDISNNRPCIGKYKSMIQALNRKYLLYDSKE